MPSNDVDTNKPDMVKQDILKHNFNAVQASIQKACQDSQRDYLDVQLLAASKRTDIQGVRLAYEMGHRLFGENRAQSLRDKHDALQGVCPEIEWHFIGHLQKNKAKYIVGRATTLQSLDSLDLAVALQNKITTFNQQNTQEIKLRVMIQVKMGDEESKTGISKEYSLDFCRKIHNDFPDLELCGLMMIPPLYGEPSDWFKGLYNLAMQGKEQGLPLHELSMGMSGDLEQAIAEGSTMIRVGTALFQGT
jgi:PLP dependent protein